MEKFVQQFYILRIPVFIYYNPLTYRFYGLPLALTLKLYPFRSKKYSCFRTVLRNTVTGLHNIDQVVPVTIVQCTGF